ncbi:hypothetical protein [Pseudomonas sp.]|uniref:hypothetical protein n=1 Tax=Pseudomonas sp. TaxID=306 RepID=UPI003D0D40D8
MTAHEVLSALESRDNHQAWLAAWALIRSPNAALDRDYVPVLDRIRTAVGRLPEPERPAVRDSRDCVRLALRIVEARSEGRCRCSVYASTDQILPESQAQHGLIDILGTRDIPWEPEFDCQCTDCGARYVVRENHGYHYPWAAWSPSPR